MPELYTTTAASRVSEILQGYVNGDRQESYYAEPRDVFPNLALKQATELLDVVAVLEPHIKNNIILRQLKAVKVGKKTYPNCIYTIDQKYDDRGDLSTANRTIHFAGESGSFEITWGYSPYHDWSGVARLELRSMHQGNSQEAKIVYYGPWSDHPVITSEGTQSGSTLVRGKEFQTHRVPKGYLQPEGILYNSYSITGGKEEVSSGQMSLRSDPVRGFCVMADSAMTRLLSMANVAAKFEDIEDGKELTELQKLGRLALTTIGNVTVDAPMHTIDLEETVADRVE